jgi:hypothetical protein
MRCGKTTSHFVPIALAPLTLMAKWNNGKVERSQRTDRIEFWMEFWSSVDNKVDKELLDEQLAQWQSFYNQERIHSAIHCKTPQARLQELLDVLPTFEAVRAASVPPQKKYVTNNHYYWAMPDSV